MRKAISYIVIAHRNATTLGSCLQSVAADALEHDELILVLNHPDEKTKSLAQQFDRWRIIFESTPGPQHARNAGARAASTEILVFLDADVCIPQGWSEAMLERLNRPWVGAGQSRILAQKAPGVVNFLKRLTYLQFEQQFQHTGLGLFSLDTAALMVKRSWFERIKGFDPQFKRLEDTDFSLRLLYAGADLFYYRGTPALELHDSEESVYEFLKKQYLSSVYLPLLLRKHGMNFRFPFGVGKVLPKGTNHLRKFYLIRWLARLLQLMAVVQSPFILEVIPRLQPVYQRSRKAMLDDELIFERSIWIDHQEVVVDLVTKERRMGSEFFHSHKNPKEHLDLHSELGRP